MLEIAYGRGIASTDNFLKCSKNTTLMKMQDFEWK